LLFTKSLLIGDWGLGIGDWGLGIGDWGWGMKNKFSLILLILLISPHSLISSCFL
jgi:hypothetical protein